MLSLAAAPVSAQSEADVAVKFFGQGGAYCFRAAPEGVTLSDETEWTVLMLTGGSNAKNAFKIRTMDPGQTGVSGGSLRAIGMAITATWRRDGSREEFFDRFAKGIASKALRARVVKFAPKDLTPMKAGERAELYLKFADRGTRVSFDKVPDLTADEFLQYSGYFPD